MSTGYWDPNSKQSDSANAIDAALLQRLLALGEAENIGDLATQMSAQDQHQSAIMHADHSQWQAALADYDEQQLIALIRFFTVVESQLSDWVGGGHSPVISIHRILKQRGGQLDREMLLWIKQNSSNRFLPNGAVL